MSTVEEEKPIKVTTAIKRADGTTPAERHLKRLCDRSFLSLWSYSGIYRDQGHSKKGGDGKEVCDLLVVFQDHVIIFSDKDCAFPDTGDIKVDWGRWFRRAVEQSAKQVWGAERWIKSHPDRLFLDRACTQAFPINLPDPAEARFHRIVVAHDETMRSHRDLGGSGSLVLMPGIIGPEHYNGRGQGIKPFAVGQIDPAKGFVHVFDDTSLGIVMRTLDTVTDFVAYLTKKEQFILGGRLALAAGEEDLLAFYLEGYNDADEHDFIIPPQAKAVVVQEGTWRNFAARPQRLAQLDADRVSYAWDRLIETFNRHVFAGTQYQASHPGFREQERLMRMLAQESRFRRRLLAGALLEFMRNSPPHLRGTRVIKPYRQGDPYYVFLLVPYHHDKPYDVNRRVRMNYLEAVCMVTKLMYPDAQDIVGIATEAGEPEDGRSEDALYYDARAWSEEDRAEAERMQKEWNLLTNLKMYARSVKEYPDAELPTPFTSGPTRKQYADYPRKQPCPCGSGKKYKRCCGDERRRRKSS